MTTKTTKTARKSAAKTKTSPILGEVDSKAKTPAKTTKGKTAAAKIPVAVRPGGEKWAAAKELLMARGGATKADLFAALRWRSMDVKQLSAKTRLAVTSAMAAGGGTCAAWCDASSSSANLKG